MKAEQFELSFTFQVKKYSGTVTSFTPAGTPTMQRVYVPDGRKELVFVFYEIENGQNLFWFDRANQYEQSMAAAISKVLLKRQLALGV